jgi:hypothetical protein
MTSIGFEMQTSRIYPMLLLRFAQVRDGFL